ncbi:ABC transporter permease subunit [Streptomyces resistomycificus]|uniref:ABC transporter permease n=2 Tax=Streptomyces resistomycificus TaxID=67356 RepID=A0A0L8L975_9ACTN|nr:ABC transporter permease subunit [Streptomyces resistomycificus]KOG34675.1 ABC transporter permease [Streptomyces resistomycificus]KUN93338.1 ABC transporter permease [Streptomyces resistomycificus]
MKRPTFPSGTAGATRALCLLAVLTTVGLLPWLSGRDPALTVLRARSAEQEPTEEALDAVRQDLGLDAGPLSLLGKWASDLARGDLGTSWVSGTDVLPSVASGLQVSLALMGVAFGVAVLLACALVAPVLVRGRGSAGAWAAMLAALPEFLLATVALLVCGVWLGWLPTSGWQGPLYMVLPALALGVPAGGLLGRLVADALPAVLDERWVELWRGAGVSRGSVSAAALKRVLPPLVPQFGMVAVGLTGGAVAVETVFAVPGIGRTALGAAKSQDLPLLQGAVLALLLLGLVTGAAAALVRRRLLGPALRDSGLSLPPARPVRAHPVIPLALFTVLAVTIGWGLLRDPYALDTTARLAAPSWSHPLGTDGLGRDVLARLGHGAAPTVGTAAAVCLLSLLVALTLGFLPGVAAGAADIANALPPVIVGILVAAVAGPGTGGAALAVALISWPPLAAHAAALVQEVRASAFLTAQRAIGASPWWILTRHVLPSVAAPVARHALLRLPGIALALASLGFLGLGAQPPAPEWGLLLDESRAYVERAPWAALAPAVALALLAGLAVSGAAYAQGRRTTRRVTKKEALVAA